MMKKILFLLIIMISSSFSRQYSYIKSSVLWEVNYPGSEFKSYILGTSHPFFGEDWLKKFPTALQHLKSSDYFFCERLVFDSIQVNSDQDSLTNPQPLGYWLGKDYQKIDSVCINYLEFAIPPSQLISQSSNLAAQREICTVINFLLINKTVEMLGFTPTFGKYLDYYLYKIAKDEKKVIVALDDESFIKDKITTKNVFSLNISENVDFFLEAGKRPVVSEKVNKLIAFASNYNNGVFDYSIPNNPRNYNDATKAIERNKIWINKLIAPLKQKNCFIAVGINHLLLAKKYGIITMLTKAGFKVKPVIL